MDSGLLLFEIKSNDAMIKLIEAIPDTWLWLDGWLEAPKGQTELGNAVKDTGLRISRFHSVTPTIIGRKTYATDGGIKIAMPDIYAVMVERKQFGFVEFDEAGLGVPEVDMPNAKKLAIGFISQGYTGKLRFYRDSLHDNKFENSARVELVNFHWTGIDTPDLRHMPRVPRLKLEWLGGPDNKPAHLEPLLAVCRELNLKEFQFSDLVDGEDHATP